MAKQEETIRMVPKLIRCSRCNGDGIWHTSATGVRLATIGGPVLDSSRPCPQCKGKKSVKIMITETQAKAEKVAKAKKMKKAKDAIDAKADAEKKAIDAE